MAVLVSLKGSWLFLGYFVVFPYWVHVVYYIFGSQRGPYSLALGPFHVLDYRYLGSLGFRTFSRHPRLQLHLVEVKSSVLGFGLSELAQVD